MGSNLSNIDLGNNRTALKVVAGGYHSCAILDNSKLKCWGFNERGQLGQENTSHIGNNVSEMGDQLEAIDLGTNRTAVDVVAGYQHTCVHLDNNKLKCFGTNGNGQLGLGHTNRIGDDAAEMGDNLQYVDLGTDRTVTKIATGYSHTCAILDNSDLKCWGLNSTGQLGKGHQADLGDDVSEMGDQLAAIDLGSNRTAIDIMGGEGHSCAILDNDDLVCWGRGGEGQLGIGNTNWIGNGPSEMGDNLNAVDLGVGRIATQVDGGYTFTCSVLDNNEIKCWGANSAGQLGIESTTQIGDQPSELGDNLSVVNLGSNRNVRQFYAAYSSSCALLDNYDVKCWGANTYGQLGQGHTNHVGDDALEMGDNLTPIDL